MKLELNYGLSRYYFFRDRWVFILRDDFGTRQFSIIQYMLTRYYNFNTYMFTVKDYQVYYEASKNDINKPLIYKQINNYVIKKI